MVQREETVAKSFREGGDSFGVVLEDVVFSMLERQLV